MVVYSSAADPTKPKSPSALSIPISKSSISINSSLLCCYFFKNCTTLSKEDCSLADVQSGFEHSLSFFSIFSIYLSNFSSSSSRFFNASSLVTIASDCLPPFIFALSLSIAKLSKLISLLK